MVKKKEKKNDERPFKKKVSKKANVRMGRPRVWGDEKKFNKTIRLSESQEILIYDNFPTLQSFFEFYYSIFKKEMEKKKTA